MEKGVFKNRHMYTRVHIKVTSLTHVHIEESFQEVAREKLSRLREQQFRSAWDVTDARPLQVSPLLSIMINTYQTSLAPPVPPRHSRTHSVLIPEPLPSQGHSKSLIWVLVGVVLLHLLLSVGGFIYLYNNGKMVNNKSFGILTKQATIQMY